MWKRLAYEPVYNEFHPCMHRWMQEHVPAIPPKKIQYIIKPISKRNEVLAMPQIRRLLTVWLNHSKILPAAKREKILQTLLMNGFTMEQLHNMMMEKERQEEIMRRKADAGPFDVFDENGNLLTGINKRKKRKNKTKLKNKKKAKDKTIAAKNKKKGGKVGKAVKAGNPDKEDEEILNDSHGLEFGPGWPHFIGLKIMKTLWHLEGTPPDERFISRAASYFDVQAQILHQITSEMGDVLITDKNRCLNIVVWIAENIIAPAHAVADKKVDTLLIAKKHKGKNKKTVAQDKTESASKTSVHQRRWTEQNFPKVVPEKKKRGAYSTSSRLSFNPSTDTLYSITSIDSTKLLVPDDEASFLNSSRWYDPSDPEFIYDGTHAKPENISFIKEGGELKWILEGAHMTPQPMQPNPVAVFCPELRPIVHSGASGPIPSQYGRWFIMSDLNFYNKKRTLSKHKQALIKEQLDMVYRMIHVMAKTTNMNINRFLELFSELVESIKFSSKDEDTTPEQQILDGKRTNILEKHFVKFFGTKLRDYNSDTSNYIHIICQRCALMIRYLYENTAIELWDKQQLKQQEAEPEEDRDQESENESLVHGDEAIDIADVEQWLSYLTRSTRVAQEWQQWLQHAVESERQPDDTTCLIEQAENWISTGENIQLEGQHFSEREVKRLTDCQI